MDHNKLSTRKPHFRKPLIGAAAFIFVLGFLFGLVSLKGIPNPTAATETTASSHPEATITPTTGEVLLVQTVSTRPPRPIPTTLRPPRPPRPLFDCDGVPQPRPCIPRVPR